MDCSVTKEEYLDFILFSLTLAEACTVDYLNIEVLESFWAQQQMFASCNTEMNYLLVRREALKL